ncbi:MAG TPA: tRNA (adenosine(37)-N6)-threonylcarbamoyltransferase complex dimerization subunit type 1 TsaB [Chthoniobacterales bacterium]
MKVLALELSSAIGGIAFCDQGELREFRIFPADRKDSGFFYQNLQEIYQAAAPPDVLVVGLGPGSYAGVRIAIATALGLRAATGAKLLGLPSIVAFDEAAYFVIGNARRGTFYFASVANGQCLEGPTLGTAEEIRVKVQKSDRLPIFATEHLMEFDGISIEHPSALRLAELALRAKDFSEEPLQPIYLRAPYITTAKK